MKKTKLLLSRHFVDIRNRKEVIAVPASKRLSNKKKGITEVRALNRLAKAYSLKILQYVQGLTHVNMLYYNTVIGSH